jgi:hypothetical protein
LAGLLPECRNTLDAKHLPKQLESLEIERLLWGLIDSRADLLPIEPCTRPLPLGKVLSDIKRHATSAS